FSKSSLFLFKRFQIALSVAKRLYKSFEFVLLSIFQRVNERAQCLADILLGLAGLRQFVGADVVCRLGHFAREVLLTTAFERLLHRLRRGGIVVEGFFNLFGELPFQTSQMLAKLVLAHASLLNRPFLLR